MRLRISHVTSYRYDGPVPYALQQVRLTPKSYGAQQVLSWRTEVTGGRRELSFDDCHRNKVDLISFDADTSAITVACSGEVDLTETHGIIGAHAGFMPLWMFLRSTPLTKPGAGCRKLAQSVAGIEDPVDRMHALSEAIRTRVRYETGISHVDWTAEDALEAGHGVCQDHAHVFVASARSLGLPARYVSGYLLMDDRTSQEATHAWAEVHLPDLGWVGYDVSNGISPDVRYVRVATGLDYGEASPVSGMRLGTAKESMAVAVEVEEIQL